MMDMRCVAKTLAGEVY